MDREHVETLREIFSCLEGAFFYFESGKMQRWEVTKYNYFITVPK